MAQKKPSYFQDVDDLVQRTPLSQVLAAYSKDQPRSDSGEHRMQCVFDESCADSSYGQLAINQESAGRLIYCHTCGVRGNLLTLIHGLENGQPPTTGTLRGQEFKTAVQQLKRINGGESIPVDQAPAVAAKKPKAVDRPRNTPMKDQENDAARKLENLYTELVTDVSEMAPAAAAYFRERPWLTPDVAEKWGVGYIPANGRSMFRRWVAYTHRDVQGNVLSYSGRDQNFQSKWDKWKTGEQDPDKRPLKHKFVKGYTRGLELYGQQVDRLEDDQLRESLQQRGLVVVEGPNDVMRLDCLGVCAVGLCSNQATNEQVETIFRFASEVAGGRIILMHDNEPKGIEGFKPLAWELMKRGGQVQIGWPNDPSFNGKQPEDITGDELVLIDKFIGSHRQDS